MTTADLQQRADQQFRSSLLTLSDPVVPKLGHETCDIIMRFIESREVEVLLASMRDQHVKNSRHALRSERAQEATAEDAKAETLEKLRAALFDAVKKAVNATPPAAA